MARRYAFWWCALLLVLAPARGVAQRAAPAGAHAPPHAARADAPQAQTAVKAGALRPRARRHLLAGAALGAVAGAALIGPRLSDAEVGPLIAYGLPAAAGAVVGAGVGYLAFRVRFWP